MVAMEGIGDVPLAEEYWAFSWIRLPYFLEKSGETRAKLHGKWVGRSVYGIIDRFGGGVWGFR